ncbi:MAG: hypothetical protein U0K37_01880 [Acutalibacteraceae bacterium]|nr:hypothetical protein [Acutalibacteraceae bacterium]
MTTTNMKSRLVSDIYMSYDCTQFPYLYDSVLQRYGVQSNRELYALSVGDLKDILNEFAEMDADMTA